MLRVKKHHIVYISFAYVFLAVINFFSIKTDEIDNTSAGRWLPLCTKDILDKRKYYTEIDNQDRYTMPLNHKDGCRLHFYNKSDIVTCVEALTNITPTTVWRNSSNDTSQQIKLHVAFVGDSRIRHMFGNFILQVILT